jgi:hypothetical protein
MSEGNERPAGDDGLFPSTGERVPPPASVYAGGGALLFVVLVALIVEFFIAAHHATDASQIVVGVLIVADVVAGAWLLSAAERRRRCVYEWRSDALELLALYAESAERSPSRPFRARPRGHRANELGELGKLAVETRDQILLAEAALRDAGAYAEASVVGDARRLAGLTTDGGASEHTEHDPTVRESSPGDEPKRGPNA